MKLKVVESFEAHFTLEPSVQAELFQLLTSEAFLAQVMRAGNGAEVEFTELLFQPVPYSSQTPKGMLPEFEPYLDSEDYIIINVPPNFMFKAKIFKPSRLCAIYHQVNA
jgi:hypothetical protein